MHTIQYDQYEYKVIDIEQGVRMLQLEVFVVMPFAVPGPDGQPTQVRVKTQLVQIAMTPDTQAELGRQLSAPFEDIEATAGEPQPLDVPSMRCGRLQKHPSHVYPGGPANEEYGEPERRWCDGLGLFAGANDGDA